MKAYEVKAIDPLVFGDGRPFAAEPGALAAGGLTMPPPSTLAGAVRARMRSGPRPDPQEIDALRRIAVYGPIRKRGGNVYVSAPSDMAVMEREGSGELCLLRSRPSAIEDAGCDLPGGIARLCRLPEHDLRPSKKDGPRWMRVSELEAWYGDGKLFGGVCESGIWTPTEEAQNEWKGLDIELDNRAHVGIKFSTLTHEEGHLFVTRGAAYGPEDSLLALVDGQLTPQAVSLGGERRMACLSKGDAEDWECPTSIREKVAEATQVALVLATPAHFEEGWRPTWLCKTLGVKLVSAVCRRREAVSGWDLALKSPKPVRWLVPAGAVYFLEVPEGAGTRLADLWLKPVSDDEPSKNDGFGLAMFFPTHW